MKIPTKLLNGSNEELADKLTKELVDKLEDTTQCTRLEVIDEHGRAYVNRDCKSIEAQVQDEGRTLKIFIK